MGIYVQVADQFMRFDFRTFNNSVRLCRMIHFEMTMQWLTNRNKLDRNDEFYGVEEALEQMQILTKFGASLVSKPQLQCLFLQRS